MLLVFSINPGVCYQQQRGSTDQPNRLPALLAIHNTIPMRKMQGVIKHKLR